MLYFRAGIGPIRYSQRDGRLQTEHFVTIECTGFDTFKARLLSAGSR